MWPAKSSNNVFSTVIFYADGAGNYLVHAAAYSAYYGNQQERSLGYAMLRLLKSSGANLMVANGEYETAYEICNIQGRLIEAAMTGKIAEVEFLLHKELHAHVLKVDVAEVEKMLKKPVDVNYISNASNGYTLINTLVCKNYLSKAHLKIFSLLLGAGASLDIPDADGYTLIENLLQSKIDTEIKEAVFEIIWKFSSLKPQN